MSADRNKLHFIGAFGDFTNNDLESARNRIICDAPGAIPDLIESEEVTRELRKNNGFVAELVLLSDPANFSMAEEVAAEAKEMGVEKVELICCY